MAKIFAAILLLVAMSSCGDGARIQQGSDAQNDQWRADIQRCRDTGGVPATKTNFSTERLVRCDYPCGQQR